MTPLESARAKLGTENWLNLVAGLWALYCYRATTFSYVRFEESWLLLTGLEKSEAVVWAQALSHLPENSKNSWDAQTLERNHHLALENR